LIDGGAGALPETITTGTAAAARPPEFQKAFTPTERLQRIEFQQGVVLPPYFT
jgi:hypothetical protein